VHSPKYALSRPAAQGYRPSQSLRLLRTDRGALQNDAAAPPAAHAARPAGVRFTVMPYVAVFIPGAPEPQRFDLRESNVLGRAPANEIVVDDPNVSRRHCKLARDGNRWVLTDLGSTNGTWLDAARVKRYALRDGEAFYIGDARVVFHVDRFIEHRPADPNEALSVAQVLTTSRALADTATPDLTKRALPTPGATVARRGQYRSAQGPSSLAFRRAPAMPIVRDTRAGGWVRVMLKAIRG
jgi:pSer/pThr/pTyr-binding forkhead associated (FHA) protein